MFIAFRVPYSPAIGVKLIATPWTDAHLQNLDGITVEQLRQEHLSKGMPADLMRVLHLAANAAVRILIFDADAPELDGTPVYAKSCFSFAPYSGASFTSEQRWVGKEGVRT